MAYRSIERKIWQDSKFRRLNTNSKLLFIYLITNSHSHYSGLYYLPLQLAAFEISLSQVDITKAIDELISCNFIKYDHDNNIIWIIKMARYQCKGLSEDLLNGICRHIGTIESPLVGEFSIFYDDFLP